MTERRARAAIEAVARHFGASAEQRGHASNGHLSIDGKWIAVTVRSLGERASGKAPLRVSRLRFDKVVQRVITRLQTALGESIPDGIAVIFTLTAPIRRPSKTAEALQDAISGCLARKSMVECADTIHGNRFRIRQVKTLPGLTSKVSALVHHPDSDAVELLDTAAALIECIGAAAGDFRNIKPAAQRWLVLTVDAGFAPIQRCRQVFSGLSMRTDFSKIVLVYPSGQVESLSG